MKIKVTEIEATAAALRDECDILTDWQRRDRG